MVKLMGGAENIVTLENCFTRVRATVRDRSVIDKESFKALGASGTVLPGEKGVQVIFGPQSEAIVNAMKRVMAGEAVPDEEEVAAASVPLADVESVMLGRENFVAPVAGELVTLDKVKDDALSSGIWCMSGLCGTTELDGGSRGRVPGERLHRGAVPHQACRRHQE